MKLYACTLYTVHCTHLLISCTIRDKWDNINIACTIRDKWDNINIACTIGISEIISILHVRLEISEITLIFHVLLGIIEIASILHVRLGISEITWILHNEKSQNKCLKKFFLIYIMNNFEKCKTSQTFVNTAACAELWIRINSVESSLWATMYMFLQYTIFSDILLFLESVSVFTFINI